MDIINTLKMLRFLRARRCRPTKFYQKRKNPFTVYDDKFFRKRYLFTKENARKIISLVEADLRGFSKGGKIPVDIQVLAALRYWGRNEGQDDCAEVHGFSQATMCRVSKNVAAALAKLATKFIKMPQSGEDQTCAMNKFEQISGMKGIIGVIGCTQLATQAVSEHDSKVHSFSVQAVCDASLKILDMVTYWKDNDTVDSKIFNESKIRDMFESGTFIGKLLADDRYQCTDYLFTPVNNPNNNKEELYNKAQIETCNVIDRAFDLWKSRFRILWEKTRLSKNNAETLIVAVAVLHNLTIIFQDQDFADESTKEDCLSQLSALENLIEIESRSDYIDKHF